MRRRNHWPRMVPKRPHEHDACLARARLSWCFSLSPMVSQQHLCTHLSIVTTTLTFFPDGASVVGKNGCSHCHHSYSSLYLFHSWLPSLRYIFSFDPFTPQFHPRILSSPPPQHLFILIIYYHTKEPSFSLMFLLARTVYATSFTHSHYEYEGQSTTLYQGCVRILDIIIIKTINIHSLTLDLQGFHRRYYNHLYVRVSGWFGL